MSCIDSHEQKRPSPNPLFRKATEQDVDTIITMWMFSDEDTYKIHLGFDKQHLYYNPDAEQFQRGAQHLLREALAAGNAYVCINEDTETILGCAIVSRDGQNETVAELAEIFVDSSFRSQGIGRQLFGYVCRNLLEQGVTRLDLQSHDSNFKSHRFYRQLGGIHDTTDFLFGVNLTTNLYAAQTLATLLEQPNLHEPYTIEKGKDHIQVRTDAGDTMSCRVYPPRADPYFDNIVRDYLVITDITSVPPLLPKEAAPSPRVSLLKAMLREALQLAQVSQCSHLKIVTRGSEMAMQRFLLATEAQPNQRTFHFDLTNPNQLLQELIEQY